MSAATRTSTSHFVAPTTARTAFTVGTVTISGAAPAAALTGRTETSCVRRSTHAPAAQRLPLQSESTTAEPALRSTEGTPTGVGSRPNEGVSGAEVWQDFVRMLIAREAAKAAHPSGRGIATA